MSFVLRACLRRSLLILAAFGCAAALRAQTPLEESRAALEQWVQTRQLISKTRSDWQADKETLAQTIQLFERELKSLDEQLTRVATNNTQVEIERQQAQDEQKPLIAGLETTESAVARLEKQVLKLSPAFPPPLAEKLEPLVKRLPAEGTPSRASAVERMQNVVGILNEVDKFNGAISVVSEIQKSPSGAEVQVETIYVGLGQAYFVDKSGEYAGVGIPSLTGWQWAPRNELAGRIQQSLAMYKNSQPAAFVSLPVQIK